MPFWEEVLILVTLMLLCWGSGFGIYQGLPDRRGFWPGSILGVIGLIILVVLVVIFMGRAGAGVSGH